MERGSFDLKLRPITTIESGEPVRSITVSPEGPTLIGRSSEADWPIPEPSMSRRHASIMRKGDDWFVTDLASTHGTFVNDRRLEPNLPVPLRNSDVITFGFWRCRCAIGSDRPGVSTSISPAHSPASVSAIPAQRLGGVAQRGLDVLMELTAQLDSADTRERVGRAVVDAVRDATGCRRVVIVEPESETELMVIASTTDDAPLVSRTLIDKASQHGMVELMVDGGQADQAQSIMDLGIRSAICAPILVDHSPSAFMMIDTRDAEGVVPKDAAAFCQSVARLTGLAFERIDAASMAERNRQLQEDLDAARRAQEVLSPPKEGLRGAVRYQFESMPGRIVAGDLFDVFALDASRTAFFLGDVSGKGVGAAIFMAACQSQLRSQLLSGADIATAMAAVNADLYPRTEASKFVTLIGGVIDASKRTAHIVDAGHGLCVRAAADGAHERVEAITGFPLGVVESTDYESVEVRMDFGTTLVVFSDGAVEQPDPAGVQFGVEGVLSALASSGDANGLVNAIIGGVRTHASAALADDLTVAALWLEESK